MTDYGEMCYEIRQDRKRRAADRGARTWPIRRAELLARGWKVEPRSDSISAGFFVTSPIGRRFHYWPSSSGEYWHGSHQRGTGFGLLLGAGEV